MYTSFYNLSAKPFQIASDPTFIWLGEKHKEALATLTYGVLDNKGFMLLTGDVGTGKTTLINTLIRRLSDDILYASVPDPRLGLSDFLNYIAHSFGIRKNFATKGEFLIYFSDFLLRCNDNGKKVLLLIDEAQLLTQDLLEEIRLLSNIQKDGLNLLNIFFVGQDEFNEILERWENRAVAQRLTLNYHLKPLTDRETEQYIGHRLAVAGLTRQVFDQEAFMEIHRYSGGFPRRINILCDHCLLTGFVREQRVIGADVVRYCAEELKIPQYVKRQNPTVRPQPQPRPEEPAAPPSYIPARAMAALAEPEPEPHKNDGSAPARTVATSVAPAPPSPVGQGGTEPAFRERPQATVRQPPAQATDRPEPRGRSRGGRLVRTFFRPLAYGMLLASLVGAGALYYFDRDAFYRLYDRAAWQVQRLLGAVESLRPASAPVASPAGGTGVTASGSPASGFLTDAPERQSAGVVDSGLGPVDGEGVQTDAAPVVTSSAIAESGADNDAALKRGETPPATVASPPSVASMPEAEQQPLPDVAAEEEITPQSFVDLPDKTIVVRFANESSDFFFRI
ncbi:MAG: AAA family ATPase [Desulfopila sp.]